ncbi:MAG: hypothetical protein ACE5KG_07090, partial [Nitrososphaerales archaeon]
GGILIVPETLPDKVDVRNKDLKTLVCTKDTAKEEIKEKSNWGTSLSGPISASHMTGILQAQNSIRPDRAVKFPQVFDGDVKEIRTWKHTSTTYEHKHYKIYAVSQTVPAVNDLIGYFHVETPTSVKVDLSSKPCPVKAPAPALFAPLNKFIRWLMGRLMDFGGIINQFFVGALDQTGLFRFGLVRVYSGTSIAGATHLELGESSTMFLPEGSYNVKAEVSIVGQRTEWSVGKVNAEGPTKLTVSIVGVEYAYYAIGGLTALGCAYGSWAFTRRVGIPLASRVFSAIA